MNLLLRSRAKYTRPNLPRPSGRPMSKSSRRHRRRSVSEDGGDADDAEAAALLLLLLLMLVVVEAMAAVLVAAAAEMAAAVAAFRMATRRGSSVPPPALAGPVTAAAADFVVHVGGCGATRSADVGLIFCDDGGPQRRCHAGDPGCAARGADGTSESSWPATRNAPRRLVMPAIESGSMLSGPGAARRPARAGARVGRGGGAARTRTRPRTSPNSNVQTAPAAPPSQLQHDDVRPADGGAGRALLSQARVHCGPGVI